MNILGRVSCSDLTAWNLDQDSAWQFLLNLGFSAMIQVVEFARSPAAGKMGLDCTPFALDFENDIKHPIYNSSPTRIHFALSHFKYNLVYLSQCR